jgi:hypothetical protein
MEDQFDLSHWVGHLVSAGAIVGAIVGYLPAVAALVAVVWYLVQLYESHTVQHYLRGRRERKIAKLTLELARLQAQRLMQQTDPNRDDLMLDGAYRMKADPPDPKSTPPQ